MLLRQTGEGVFAITQPAHAWLSGLMLGAWGNERFAPPTPRQEVCLAAGLHDIGWLDWERRPAFDPNTGWPRVFADVPAEEHTRLWEHGVDQVGVYSRYAAVLVSMHGETIYDKTFDPATARPEAAEAVRRFREACAAFQQQVVEQVRGDAALATEASDERLAFNKRLLGAVDTLSLQVCWDAERAEIADAPVRESETATLVLTRGERGSFVLDPWPFAPPSLTLHVQGRYLAHPFQTQGEMAAALDRAEVSTLEMRLEPR